MLSEAYGLEAMQMSCAFKWHKRFKKGRENVEADDRPGRPRTHKTDKNAEKFRNLVHLELWLCN
jgi:hypothetical protein